MHASLPCVSVHPPRCCCQARLEVEEKTAREARIPRAQLLPLSTDVPMVPPRPEPKGLTIPRPFRLRSEVRERK